MSTRSKPAKKRTELILSALKEGVLAHSSILVDSDFDFIEDDKDSYLVINKDPKLYIFYIGKVFYIGQSFHDATSKRKFISIVEAMKFIVKSYIN